MIINWTHTALDSLDVVFDYISRDAPIYAQSFVRQLMAAVDRLEQFPESGRLVPEAQRNDVREVIYRGYRIIYWRVSHEQIDILGVRHSSQDLSHPTQQPWDPH